MGVRFLTFGVRGVDANPDQNGNQSLDGAGGINELTADNLINANGIKFAQLLLFVGEANNGDLEIDAGESAYNLSDMGNRDQVTSLALANGDDAVRITAHGLTSNGTRGDLTGALRFDNERGFGLDNAPDGETAAHWLNRGDSVSFALREIGGVKQHLAGLSFIVNTASAAPEHVVIDFDGDVAIGGGAGVLDGIDLGPIADGSQVVIDFLSRTITIAGVARAMSDSEYAAFLSAGLDEITIGSALGSTAGFSIQDLCIASADAEIDGTVIEAPAGGGATQGTSSSDIVVGSQSADQIDAGAGADVVFGGGGDDVIFAGAGDDVAEGGDGDDVIDAGDGDDAIIGGVGDDTLTGGAGSDVFIFRSLDELSANTDHITDFEPGADTIDLSAIGGLSFIGDGAFTGTAGEVRIEVVGATTEVQIDADGDGTLDDRIVIDNGRFNLVETAPGSLVLEVRPILGTAGNDVLTGIGVYDERFVTGAGNDAVQGRGGDDLIEGGDGADQLRGDGGAFYVGPSGNDTLKGEAGNDIMWGGAGVDSFDGGDGEDRVSFYFAAATQGAIASLLTQTITNDGFGNAETMISIEGLGGGTAFADWFEGNDGANILLGGGGDTILALGGDDEIYLSGAGALIDGGDGIDWIAFTTDAGGELIPDSDGDGLAESIAAETGVTLNLVTGELLDDGFGRSGTILNVENVYATTLADAVAGSHGDNVIWGDAGDDFLQGMGGHDEIYGGEGNDTLQGDGGQAYQGPSGNDFLFGEAGDDLLRGGAGVDYFDGGDGFDRITFYDLAATQGVYADLFTQTILNDGFGNAETMVGIEGLGGGTAFADTFIGNDASNVLSVSIGDTALGYGGDDEIWVTAAPASLEGGDGNDTLSFIGDLFGYVIPDSDGDGLAETIFPEWGVDVNLLAGTIFDDGFGHSGAFTSIENVITTDFDDFVIGSNEDNSISVAGGNDFVQGRGGDDLVEGGDGNDAIRGDGGSFYNGPSGDDTLSGGAGDDVMWGGAGIDAYDGGDGNDRISFYAAAATQGAIASLLTQTISNDGFGNAETMLSIEGLGSGTAFADWFEGDNNSNIMFGGGGDTILAINGDDEIYLSGAGALIDGGDGIDHIIFTTDQGGEIVPDTNGDGLAETLTATAGVNIDLSAGLIHDDGFGRAGTVLNVENINATSLDDVIVGADGANIILAGAGDDIVQGRGGDDHIEGGDGNDAIRGDGGAFYGGPSGNDVLIGGAGDDIMWGGAGVDAYDGGDGNDRISFYASAATQGVIADISTQTILNDGFGNVETMVSVESLGAGTAYADHLTGDDNVNIMLAGVGDTILARGGDDIIELTGGAALVDGGDGIDTITDFAQQEVPEFFPDADSDGHAEAVLATSGVHVDLSQTAIVDDGFGNSGVVINVENVGGSALADILIGDAGDNVLTGWEDNDTLRGGAGVDQLIGWTGDDVLSAGAAIQGGEIYDGGAGTDTLTVDSAIVRPDGHHQVNFNIAQINSIERLAFTETGTGTTYAIFNYAQLGGGLANDLHIVGSENNDEVLFVAVGPGTYSLAGTAFTFENWTSGQLDYWSNDHIHLFATLGVNYTLIGSDRIDVIQGNAGADIISGGAGGDVLIGRAGADAYDGGDGDDYFVIGFADPDYYEDYSLESYDGGAGNDVLWVTGQFVDLRGSGIVLNNMEGIAVGGALTYYAGPPAYTAEPFQGGQVVVDLAFLSQLPSALIVSGSGSYIVPSGEHIAQLDVFTIVMQPGDTLDMSSWTFLRWEAQDRITVTGSSAHDNIFGSSQTDVIQGRAGNDLIDGGAGDDQLRGDGPSFYNGPSGDDMLFGGAGDDTMWGGAGIDFYDGGDGFDRVSFYAGAATQGAIASLLTQTITNDGFGNIEAMSGIEGLGSGTAFADWFEGDDNDNIMFGGAGDTILGLAGADEFWISGAGALIDGGDGIDHIIFITDQGGEIVPDTTGDGIAEIVTATAGINLNLAANVLIDDGFGQSGTIQNIENVTATGFGDFIIGSDAQNIILSGAGNDIIQGRGGGDTIDGGEGNDSLRGDGGSFYNGPSGDDVLIGGAGDDTMWGGAGIDQFDGGDGNDRVSLFAAAATQAAVASLLTQTITNDGFGNAETMVSIEGLGAGTAFADWLEGDDGANMMFAGAGDTILALGGDDEIYAGGAGAVIDGGAGVDILIFNGDVSGDLIPDTDSDGLAETVYASSGIHIDLSQSLIIDDGFGHSGALLNVERVLGSSLDDVLIGDGGDNWLFGQAGIDQIEGGGGADAIDGGADADVLTGGAGDDLFVFYAGEADGDVIADFSGNGAGAGDLIILNGYGLPGDGASVSQIDATHWQITSADGLTVEIIELANGATLDPTDLVFNG